MSSAGRIDVSKTLTSLSDRNGKVSLRKGWTRSFLLKGGFDIDRVLPAQWKKNLPFLGSAARICSANPHFVPYSAWSLKLSG